jgi:hypothetical protein
MMGISFKKITNRFLAFGEKNHMTKKTENLIIV